MGIIWLRPCYVERLHEVEVSERSAVSSRGETVVRRTYTTPVGSVYLDEKREAGSGSWHADLGWTGMSPWLTARLIKEPEDYEVVKREFPISTRSGQHTP